MVADFSHLFYAERNGFRTYWGKKKNLLRKLCTSMYRCAHTHVHTHTQQWNATLVQSPSCVRSFVTLETTAHQIPLSMGLPRQEYWGGLPWPSPGDLPDPGIEPWSPALTAGFLTTESQMEKPILVGIHLCLPVSFASYFYLFFFLSLNQQRV